LEALQRFFEPQEVANPQLVLVVGCCGLLSNILGLLLFHEHSHGHGHGEHEAEHTHAGHTGDEVAVEEGRVPSPVRNTQYGTEAISNEDATVGPQKDNGLEPSSSEPIHRSTISEPPIRQVNSTDFASKSSPSVPFSPSRRSRRRASVSRSRYSSVDEIHVHPASFRNDIIAASRMESIESEPATDSELSSGESHTTLEDDAPLLHRRRTSGSKDFHDSHHAAHKHRKPKSSSDKHGGHSHGDLNMRGVFLHVLGDALGNIGVIASALFIWQTNFWWRFYSDPVISLIITVIILCSALPLCRAASRILLQGVPAGLSIDDIKDDIEDLPGVVSCHHLHVWQLSDTKLVASLHIQVAFDYRGTDAKQYMRLAKAVRTCLHEYGIHSSTIQPEFCLDASHHHAPGGLEDGLTVGQLDGGTAHSKQGSKLNSRAASVLSLPDACLLDCGDDCARGRGCCPASNAKGH
jgi:solute carrier family 30 (zinc transporter), member 1